ncbi:DNA methyltransferase [Neisseriaceae bacterium B1]
MNGGLFREPLREFAFTADLLAKLQAASRFDWSGISPEIFGTLFQSVMNETERREAGAHYTEADNIEKVINSLFLEDLCAEFAQIQAAKGNKNKLIGEFYQKIQSLRFLDPACGCGNFLIVAYDHLRQLEDDVIAEILSRKKQ